MQPVFREAVYWQTRRSDISGSPALSFTYSPDICKVSATAISSVSQLWEQTLCNYFPTVSFPICPKSVRNHGCFLQEEDLLLQAAPPKFCSTIRIHRECKLPLPLPRQRSAAPTRHSIMLLFPQQFPSLFFFLPLEHTPILQTIC